MRRLAGAAADHQILVAEDNETNRKVIYHQLQLIGFGAEFAEDGQRALELWRTGKYGLLLTDLQMPRMDGYALAAAIRAEEKLLGTRRTAIVALTANALRDDETRCRAAGMDAHVGKPVRLERLQEVLGEVAAGNTRRCGVADCETRRCRPRPDRRSSASRRRGGFEGVASTGRRRRCSGRRRPASFPRQRCGGRR